METKNKLRRSIESLEKDNRALLDLFRKLRDSIQENNKDLLFQVKNIPKYKVGDKVNGNIVTVVNSLKNKEGNYEYNYHLYMKGTDKYESFFESELNK